MSTVDRKTDNSFNTHCKFYGFEYLCDGNLVSGLSHFLFPTKIPRKN